jgi:hypothetical protein
MQSIYGRTGQLNMPTQRVHNHTRPCVGGMTRRSLRRCGPHHPRHRRYHSMALGALRGIADRTT